MLWRFLLYLVLWTHELGKRRRWPFFRETSLALSIELLRSYQPSAASISKGVELRLVNDIHVSREMFCFQVYTTKCLCCLLVHFYNFDVGLLQVQVYCKIHHVTETDRQTDRQTAPLSFSYQNKDGTKILTIRKQNKIKTRLSYSLEVDIVSSEIQRFAQKHEERFHHHENAEVILLVDNMGIVCRLQRKKTFWASLIDSVKAETVLV